MTLFFTSLTDSGILYINECMSYGTEPNDDIGIHCHEPHSCGFYTYCTRKFPKPNFFDIRGVRKTLKFELYKDGLISFDDLQNCNRLKDKQIMQIKHEIKGLPPHINKPEIKKFLNGLYYPLYFLDFETFNPAIPLYKDSKPYEQIVFQYSLHYIENENGQLHHLEFIAPTSDDPRRAVAENLCRNVPINACILAYNMTFEKNCIKKLSVIYDDLSEYLMKIHNNIQDLMRPFFYRDYYCTSMHGSYSIKYVLPALFPNDPTLDYNNLNGVRNGSDASTAYMKMLSAKEDEQAEIRNSLLKYCELDTLAMVKIWQFLHDITK